MHIRFVTGNDGKVREARDYLSGIAEVTQVEYDYTEIQHHSLGEIARRGSRDAFDGLANGFVEGAPTDDAAPVLVDDSGLFVDALDGFPGPYSAYVEDTVGVERLWRLVREEENRRAHFRTILAYTDGDRTETFEGRVSGTIVPPRGDGGFGYDPIFEYNGDTMAEMDTDQKNAISHRGRALAAFAEWLAERE